MAGGEVPFFDEPPFSVYSQIFRIVLFRIHIYCVEIQKIQNNCRGERGGGVLPDEQHTIIWPKLV
jgi:hypothetical protein